MYRASVVVMLALILLSQGACSYITPPPDFDFDGVKHNFARIYDLDEVDLTLVKADPATVTAKCYEIASGPQAIIGALTLQTPPACTVVRADPNDPTYRPQCTVYYIADFYLEHELNHCRGYPYKVPHYEERDHL